jgi:protein SCO1/2
MLWGFLVVVLVGVAGLGLWSLVTQQPMATLVTGQKGLQLPVYGTVPEFALIERSGRPVRRGDLHGKVWIAGFIFTHCPDECPLMTAEMARLQADFAAAADLRLVSITVDPERDTPTVLSQYAAQFQADPQRWLFLTGDKRAIHQLAKEGFRLGISAPAGGSQGALLGPSRAWADHSRGSDIGHSARLVLVDRQARIRGYYDSRDGLALQRLRRHAQSLLQDT